MVYLSYRIAGVLSLHIILFMVFVPPPIVYAQNSCTYTVGNGQQYATIQSAVDSAKAAGAGGKTICILDNKTYEEIIKVYDVQATSNQQFRIIGHPSNVNKPVIKRTAANTDPAGADGAFEIYRSNNVFIQNIAITFSAANAFSLIDSQSIHITDVIAENIWATAVRMIDVQNSIVENCYINKAQQNATPENYKGGYWGNVIGSINRTETYRNTSFRNGNIFRNCEITNSQGELMSSLRSRGDTFENNYLHHNNRVGDQNATRRVIITSLYADHAPEVTFRNNYLLYNHYNIGFLDENEYKTGSLAHHRTVDNNLIVGPVDRVWSQGIGIAACESGVVPCPLENDTIKNNTIVNSSDHGMIIRSGYTSVVNTQIQNNIIVSSPSGSSLYMMTSYPGITFAGNIYAPAPINNVGMTGGQVVDRNTIFENNSALNTTLYTQEIPATTFKAKAVYAGKGADVSKVGLIRKTDYKTYKADSITPTPIPASCPNKNRGDADCKFDSFGKPITVLDYAIWYGEYISGCSTTNISKCGNDADGDGNAMDANFNYPGTSFISTDMKVDIFDYAVWIQGYLSQ